MLCVCVRARKNGDVLERATKEPNISTKEPKISTKEPNISTKEPNISAQEPLIYAYTPEIKNGDVFERALK